MSIVDIHNKKALTGCKPPPRTNTPCTYCKGNISVASTQNYHHKLIIFSKCIYSLLDLDLLLSINKLLRSKLYDVVQAVLPYLYFCIRGIIAMALSC